MTFAWAAKNQQTRQTSLETLRQRFSSSAISTRYYNPYIHQAAFALPQYVLQAIGKTNND
jgi:spermidine synthase